MSNVVIKKTNEKNVAHVRLRGEYKPSIMNSENQETVYEERYKETNPVQSNLKIENANELEQDLSEAVPTKRKGKLVDTLGLPTISRLKARVRTYEKLSNGITPQEIMYGKEDDDFDYINKSLE